MKPDKRQLRLFEDAPDRMELKDYQKKKSVRKPKRKGFNYADDVKIGEEVDVSVEPYCNGKFIPGIVRSKETDIAGTTVFFVDVENLSLGIMTLPFRLGELYRRMK